MVTKGREMKDDFILDGEKIEVKFFVQVWDDLSTSKPVVHRNLAELVGNGTSWQCRTW